MDRVLKLYYDLQDRHSNKMGVCTTGVCFRCQSNKMSVTRSCYFDCWPDMIRDAPNIAILFFLSTGICIWQVWTTIQAYLEYPKATYIEERLIGGRLYQENLDVYFPAITVCNIQPLVSNHR